MNQKDTEQINPDRESETNSVMEKRQEVAQNFYEQGGWQAEELPDHISGINLNEEVNIKNLEIGTQLASYQTPKNIQEGKQGNYYAPMLLLTNTSTGEQSVYKMNLHIHKIASYKYTELTKLFRDLNLLLIILKTGISQEKSSREVGKKFIFIAKIKKH